MKRFLMSTVAAGFALSMIGAPLAMAEDQQHPGPQGAPHGDDAHPSSQQHAPEQHAPEQHAQVQHPPEQHATVQHSNTPPRQMSQVSHQQQHPAPPRTQQGGPPPMQHQAAYSGHHWHNGDHYTGSRTYITNYNNYHLNPPPSGYQWVQDGGQFVLIAVASGIIANVILNAAYQ